MSSYCRGDIVDRNGTYLATTEKVYNLILDPRQIMSDQEDYLEASITALSTVLGYDAGELRTLITGNPDTAYVRYARQLSYDQKEAFLTYQKETNEANSKADSKARFCHPLLDPLFHSILYIHIQRRHYRIPVDSRLNHPLQIGVII